MRALKRNRTEILKVLANCSRVDLDVVDEDFNHLENMHIYVGLTDLEEEAGFVEDVEDIDR